MFVYLTLFPLFFHCSVAVFTHHPMHPFCPLSSLCSRPNPLIPTSSLADTLTTNPLNPAESWRKSQHLQPCCLQLCLLSHWCHRNLQTKHGCESLQPCRLTLSLWLHSILPLHSRVLHLAYSILFWRLDTEYLKPTAVAASMESLCTRLHPSNLSSAGPVSLPPSQITVSSANTGFCKSCLI